MGINRLCSCGYLTFIVYVIRLTPLRVDSPAPFVTCHWQLPNGVLPINSTLSSCSSQAASFALAYAFICFITSSAKFSWRFSSPSPKTNLSNLTISSLPSISFSIVISGLLTNGCSNKHL